MRHLEGYSDHSLKGSKMAIRRADRNSENLDIVLLDAFMKVHVRGRDVQFMKVWVWSFHLSSKQNQFEWFVHEAELIQFLSLTYWLNDPVKTVTDYQWITTERGFQIMTSEHLHSTWVIYFMAILWCFYGVLLSPVPVTCRGRVYYSKFSLFMFHRK